MTTTPKPDEFAGLTREMLITQIHQLRDLITMEREAAKQTEEALREAHDHAQEGLKSARKQEREMRARIAELEEKR